MYHSHRSEALKVLYKSKELHKDQSETIEADFEEVAASCGHFSSVCTILELKCKTFWRP